MLEVLAIQRSRQAIQSGVDRIRLRLVQHAHRSPEMDQHARAPRLFADKHHGHERAFSLAHAERLRIVAGNNLHRKAEAHDVLRAQAPTTGRDFLNGQSADRPYDDNADTHQQRMKLLRWQVDMKLLRGMRLGGGGGQRHDEGSGKRLHENLPFLTRDQTRVS